jgi:hypothetical protein
MQIEVIHDLDRIRNLGELAAKYHPENFGKYFAARISKYAAFYLITLNNKPAAISGIYRDPNWFKGLYRVADRSFYFPIIREKSISHPDYKENKTFLSQVLIPKQTEYVLKQGGIPFYSMLNRPHALQRSINLHNDVSRNKYILLQSLYWTCPGNPREDAKCWQSICTLEQYSEKFYDKTLRTTL